MKQSLMLTYPLKKKLCLVDFLKDWQYIFVAKFIKVINHQQKVST